MGSTAEKIRERRLDRMRLGQAVCEYVTLISDSEIRVCIVPLTEAQYLQALNKVAGLNNKDDLAGLSIRDRVQSQEILVRAIREESDLTRMVFSSVEEMMESLDVYDVDHLIDEYSEMVAKSSPAMDQIPQHELDALKKALQTMDWNELNGPAWYAAKRFLSTIMPLLQMDNSPGSTSTNSSITTSE